MPTFDSSGQPSVPLPASITNARAQVMANLEAKLSGKKLSDLPATTLAGSNTPPTAPVAASNPKIELAPEQPEPEPVVVETPVEESVAETSAAPEVATPAPAPAAPKSKLSKSMQIQRRAEEATRRARAEMNKLRQNPAPTSKTETTKAASPVDAEKVQYE